MQKSGAFKTPGVQNAGRVKASLLNTVRFGLVLSSAVILTACVSGGGNLNQAALDNGPINLSDSDISSGAQASLADGGNLQLASVVPVRAPRSQPNLPVVAATQSGSELPQVEATALVSENTVNTRPLDTAIVNAQANPTQVNTAATQTLSKPVAPSDAQTSPQTVEVASLSPAPSETIVKAIPPAQKRQSGKPRVVPTQKVGNGTNAVTVNTAADLTDGNAVGDVEAINAVPVVEPEKPKSFFARLFSSKKKKQVATRNSKPKVVKAGGKTVAKAKSVEVASLEKTSKPKVVRARNGNALPGVKKQSALFGISREDAKEEVEANSIKVASLGGFGRLSPNGLVLQHKGVSVGCFKPGLLRVLKRVERNYGKKVVVTSGYRSPKANRRAGGAKRSKHILCQAADIQVPGVSKWKLAKFLRSISGRGGVGTYCHTKSVHIDIGSKRDWNYRCRRSSVRKRKS